MIIESQIVERLFFHAWVYISSDQSRGAMVVGSEAYRQWLNFYSNQILVVHKTVAKISQNKPLHFKAETYEGFVAALSDRRDRAS